VDGAGGAVWSEADLPAWAPPEVIAQRLSRLIWNAEPDDAVRGALAGIMLTRVSVEQVARQMLSDDRARAGIAAFYRWWLFHDIERSPDSGPLAVALALEAPTLGAHLTLDVDGTFADLLTVPYTFVNEALASRYGMQGVFGPEMRQAPYPAGEPRIGLLTGAGILTFYSSLANPSWPAKRSWMVTDSLLCWPVIRSFLPSLELDTSRSIRQQMLDATASPACEGCHKLLNSPGFAYIGFDSFGSWHPESGAAENETRGWIPAEIMADAPTFDGPFELAHLLATRDEPRRCFVRQWLQYSTDRSQLVGSEIADQDRPSVEVALSGFAASGFRLRDLISAVAGTNVFLRP
jgi:Protein of unknown function (DUF1592)/Protein of unknown function (DUF1588)/Protein of unknown function (DUF1585)